MRLRPCNPSTTTGRRPAFALASAWLTACVLTTAAAGAAGATEATDEAPPEQYRQHCIACHARMTGGDGALLYRRKDRLVNDYAALVERVAHCRQGTGAAWSKAQEDEVVRYLNRSFYRFDVPRGETPE